MALELVEKIIAGDVDHEVCDWLRRGLAQYLAGDGELDQCLRLDRVAMLRERNQALLAAAALLDTGAGAWHTAGRLAKAIRFHQVRIAPRLRRDPAAEIGELDQAIRRALAAGRCPTTQRRLYDLIR